MSADVENGCATG